MKNRAPSDLERLQHILAAIESIETFTKKMTEEEFLKDQKTQSAVLYQFVIIGEAVAFLSLELTERVPYAWHKPRSFRNFIAHEYYGIKMWMVWNAIKEQLPELKTLMLEINKS